eukprot:TRINITY_DN10691_c0_g1_i2.p1 TRINITY_DN10691_c0_g1~~TRINITY_DN10691_c0_g1_i2.p1  ORF type:complete len:131 (+),score=4.85 TRINITY_DN10691_c0_g1_i2:131-523(+)
MDILLPVTIKKTQQPTVKTIPQRVAQTLKNTLCTSKSIDPSEPVKLSTNLNRKRYITLFSIICCILLFSSYLLANTMLSSTILHNLDKSSISFHTIREQQMDEESSSFELSHSWRRQSSRIAYLHHNELL